MYDLSKKPKLTAEQEHALKMRPEILRLIAETELKVSEIAEIVKVGETAIYRACKLCGIDIAERTKRLGHRKGQATTRKSKKVRCTAYSRVPESMTKDGVSLEWLTKAW